MAFSRRSTSRRNFTDWGRTIRRQAIPSRAGQKTYSEVFAETMVKLADENEKVVAITAAMPNGTALDHFPAAPSKEVF